LPRPSGKSSSRPSEENKPKNYKKKCYPLKKYSKPSSLKPILPLLPEVVPSREEDKKKFVSFELKARAGQPAGSTTYKKHVRVFEEDTPQLWIDLVRDIEEIWTQNSVAGPTDRTSTIRALLKGESATAFEVALEDARVNPVPNGAPLAISNEIIETAMSAVAKSVFPHRALEIQRLWMNRAMKKPYELSTRKTAAAITRINNCLPLFPTGSAASKFSEVEIVGLLEWSLPPAWRSQFDLKGYIPTLETKSRLIAECEAIEWNETETKPKKVDENNNNKKHKKTQNAKSQNAKQKNGAATADNAYFCKECGRNGTHDTPECFKLKNKAKRAQKAAEADVAKKPTAVTFLKCTFRKEVNALARKASKKKVMGLFESALKREQVRQVKLAKKHATARIEELEYLDSDESLHVLERMTIPRKPVLLTTSALLKKKALKVQFKKAVAIHKKKKAEEKAAATLEEEAAFIKKITHEEPSSSESSSSENTEAFEDTVMSDKD